MTLIHQKLLYKGGQLTLDGQINKWKGAYLSYTFHKARTQSIQHAQPCVSAKPKTQTRAVDASVWFRSCILSCLPWHRINLKNCDASNIVGLAKDLLCFRKDIFYILSSFFLKLACVSLKFKNNPLRGEIFVLQ